MSEQDEHVYAGHKPFGLRRFRAVCSCGYETKPVEGQELEAIEAARRMLIRDHGARESYPGEMVGVPLVGEAGPVRPRPSRPRTAPSTGCEEDRPRRLP